MENDRNYLIKSVINQSINIKHRKKRIQPSAWLPEPVATEQADTDINRREVLTYSMLVLLEHLNARERAVFILKEAFDYSHDEIAEILSMSIGNSRKLLSRAKSKLSASEQIGVDSSFDTAAYLERYISVIKNGDTRALEKLLSEEVLYTADGGGRIKVVSEFNVGIAEVARQVSYVYQHFQKKLLIRTATVNHQPALLFYRDNTLITCQVFELEVSRDQPAKIRRIFTVVDPDKLKTFNLV